MKTKQKAVAAMTSALIQRVRLTDGVSRIELAREMGLAPSTIGQYVDRLIDTGVLREGEKSQRSAGRPPTILELNPHVGQFVGVDIEARQVSATAIDFSQESLHRCKEKIHASDSAETVIERIKAIISDVAGRERRLLGIGVGVPGTVDDRRGVAVHYEFIRGWQDIPLANQLSRKFGVPVYLENNIRAMALAERWFGRARRVENFVCLGVRSGIGAGVVIDGKLHRGLGNMAGEIGGWPCPSANKELDSPPAGTLEHKASVRAILRQLTEEARNGAKTSLKVPANRTVAIEDLLRAASDRDPLVTKVLGRAAEYIGRTICQINLLLNPEEIIIAGPLAELEDGFLKPIRNVVEGLQGLAMVRERAPFTPMASDAQIRFADQVVLVRAPLRVTFSYAGPDQVWQPDWHGQKQLPDMIRVTVRDSTTGQVLAVSGAATVHVNAAAECVRAKNPASCLTGTQKPDADKKDADKKEEQL